MSAAEALTAARSAGISVSLDGPDLVLKAAARPPTALLDELARHKAEVVALLSEANAGGSAGDWFAFLEERATIAELKTGLPRSEAETRAFACCVAEWLNRNHEGSPPGQCLACGQREHAHDRLLPFGTETAGHAWLHQRCWNEWYASRKAEAAAALAEIGIVDRSSSR